MMKPITTFLAMLFLGTVTGFVFAPALFQWLTSAFGARIIATSLGGSFVARFQFGLGCGALFGAAPIASTWIAQLSRPVLWIPIYLSFGCLISGAVAAFYHATYSWAATDVQQLKLTALVSFSELPALRIPLIGAFAVLGLGLFSRFLSKPHDASNSQTHIA